MSNPLMRYLAALGLAAFSATAAAVPLAISYGGRLTAGDGAPLAGPVVLGIKLYHGPQADVPSTVAIDDQIDVALREGVFQITLDLAPGDLDAAFGPAETWIEVTDKTHGRTYPKQRYLAVPYALRVPVDGTSVAFDGSGQLTVAGVDQAKVTGLAAALSGKADQAHAHTLTGDVTGPLDTTVVAKLNGNPVTSATPIINQVLQWNGAAWAPATVGGVGTPESTTASNAAAGTGSSLFKAQNTYDLVFRKLNAGTGITVTENADDVTVASTMTQYTDTLARSAISASAPVAYSPATGVVSLAKADGSTNGYLASTDFTALSGKQAAITAASTVNAGTVTSALQNGHELKPFGTGAGNTGELRFTELAANGADYVGFKAPDAVATPRIWTLPAADGTNGHVLATDGAGSLAWIPQPSAPVASVAGKTGVVTLSTTDVGEGTGLYYTDTRARGAVSATTPLAYVAGTGVFSLPAATGSQNGYLSSADWTAFNGKEGAVAASTTGKYWRGDKTWQTLDTAAVAEGGSLYFTNARARAAVSATAPLGYNGATGVLSLPASTGAVDGYLAATDFATFSTAHADRLKWDGGNTGLNAATGRTSLGLGALATLSAVGSAEITDDAIVDADVNASAGIAQSKIAGLTAALAGKGDVFNGGQAGALTLGTTNATALTLKTDNAAAITLISGGNVGIGTSSPGGKLHLKPATDTGSETVLRIEGNNADNDVYHLDIVPKAPAGSDINYEFRVKDWGGLQDVAALTIGGHYGYIGIGTANPTQPLQVSHASSARLALVASDADSAAGISFGNDARAWLIQNQGSNADKLIFHDVTAGLTRMTMDGAGNVGIGTTSPQARLDVAGEVRAGNTSLACSSSTSGSMRFNTTSKQLESCTSLDSGASYAWSPQVTRLTDNLTLTATAGSCPTIQSLIDSVIGVPMARGVVVTINLPDGTYNCTSPISISNFNSGSLNITGNTTTPSSVTLSFANANGFNIDSSTGVLLNGMRITYTGATASIEGLLVFNHSRVALGNKMDIRNFNTSGSTCIYVADQSRIYVNAPDATNHLTLTSCTNGVLAYRSSSFIGLYSSATGTGTTAGTAFFAGSNSYLDASNGSATNFNTAYYAVYTSTVMAVSTSAATYNVGYYSSFSSSIHAGNASAAGGATAFYSVYSSFVYADGASATTSTNGFYAAQGGFIRATTATVSGNTTNYTPDNVVGNMNSYVYH